MYPLYLCMLFMAISNGKECAWGVGLTVYSHPGKGNMRHGESILQTEGGKRRGVRVLLGGRVAILSSHQIHRQLQSCVLVGLGWT